MDKYLIQNAFKSLDEIEEENNNKLLTEKLPKDLSTAYKYAIKYQERNYMSEKNDTGFQLNGAGLSYIPYTIPYKRNRKQGIIDYEKAQYKDISNEDRLEIAKKYNSKSERSKLRFLFKGQGGNYPVLFMYNKDGDPIFDSKDFRFRLDSKSPLYFRANPVLTLTFKNIVLYADKIYETNENSPENFIDRSKDAENNSDYAELIDLIDTNNYKKDSKNKGYSYTDIDVDQMRRSLVQAKRDKSVYSDTGSHEAGSVSINKKYYSGSIDKYKNDYLKSLDSSDDDKIYSWNRPENTLKKLQDAQYIYNAKRRLDNYKRNPINFINFNVARYKILRSIADETLKMFKKISAYGDDAAEQSNYDDEYDYFKPLMQLSSDEYATTGVKIIKNKYMQAFRKKIALEKEIESLMDQVKEITNQIADIDKSYSDEDKEEGEKLKASILDNLVDNYEKTISSLNDVINEFKNKEQKNIKESLENYSKDYQLRIYTRDTEGKENFIDDFSNEEEAYNKYNELCADKNYEQVCLVGISDKDTVIILDNQNYDNSLEEEITDKRSIGEIVDDKLKKMGLKEKDESLKESKAFNLKDPDDVQNAKAYKAVGEKTDEPLVVMDPSIESKDDKNNPHVGDAILQCPRCKQTFFKPVDELVKDTESEDKEIYNKDEACPHCGVKDTGFIYLYQVGLKDGEKEEPEFDESTEDNIEDNQEEKNENKLPSVENDFVDLNDVQEIQEESFDKLINPYLTKLYENVKSYKTTNVKQTGRNEICVEGTILGNNDKSTLVEFMFKSTETNVNSILFEGYSKLLTDDKNAFKLKANVNNNKLIFESFSYNYNKEVDGNQVLIEGVEK